MFNKIVCAQLDKKRAHYCLQDGLRTNLGIYLRIKRSEAHIATVRTRLRIRRIFMSRAARPRWDAERAARWRAYQHLILTAFLLYRGWLATQREQPSSEPPGEGE